MGQQTPCCVRYRGAASSGKAQLETDDLRFQGEFRLRLPLAELCSVEASDGELRVAWPAGEAVFELGPLAERWAQKLRNPRTLLDKLGVKPGQRVAVLGVTDVAFWEHLRARGVDITEELRSSLDHILLQADERAGLEPLLALRSYLTPAGGVWVVAPKGVRTITELDVLNAGRAAGLTDVKVARFSATHTAHRFVIPLAQRAENVTRMGPL
jgi:hypothetical protein